MNKALILQLVSMIDLTTLDSKDNEKSVLSFIQKANAGIEGIKPAAICLYPNFAEFAHHQTDIPIAVVAGNFPSGQTFIKTKIDEIKLAANSPTQEIDVVINRGKVLEGDFEYLRNELRQFRAASGEKILKVILESGELDVESLRKVAKIAIDEGADFIKTSTGKSEVGATYEAARIMCEEIKLAYVDTGKKVGFKASGGIRTFQDAIGYYEVVDEILGKEWLTPTLFRIGASSLFDNLNQDIKALK